MRSHAGRAAAAALGVAASALVAVTGAEAGVAAPGPRPYEVAARGASTPLAVGPRHLDVPLTWSKAAVKPVSRAITYRNATRKAMKVRLKVALRDRTGRAAPAALARLSSTSLSVRAGREARVDLALRRYGIKPGRYQGTVQVTSATGQALGSTAVSVDLRAPIPKPAAPVGNVTASAPAVIADLASPGIPDLTRKLKLVYRNSGSKAVALRLAADMNGPGGEPTKAPAGLLSLPAKATVPARGSTTVTLTFRGAKIPHGRHIGALYATSADGRTKVTTTLVADVGREKYNVGVKLIDRTGATVKSAWVYGWSVSDGGRWERKVENGKGLFDLPPGTYDLTTTIRADAGETLVNHRITVDDWDLNLVMDARQGRPVELSPQGVGVPGEIEAWLETPWYRMTAEGPAGSVFAVWNGPAPTDQRVGFQVLGSGKSDATTGPGAAYILSRWNPTGIPASTVWHPAPGELSVTRNQFRSANLTGEGELILSAGFVEEMRLKVVFPQTVTTYIEPGLLFSRQLMYGIEWENNAEIADYRRPAVRGELDDPWNGAALTPGGFAPSAYPYRSDDQLVMRVSRGYHDSAGRYGWIDRQQSALTLTADGETLATGTNDLYAGLPPESKRYTLTWARTANPEIARFSTRTVNEWSFDSGHTDSWQKLPLHLLRLAVPGLNAANAAAPGTQLKIPVKVEPVLDLPAPTITSMSVETSADDGQTWQAGSAAQDGGTWTASVTVPGSPGYVSLRIKATDSDGNTVTQTIIRTFEVKS